MVWNHDWIRLTYMYICQRTLGARWLEARVCVHIWCAGVQIYWLFKPDLESGHTTVQCRAAQQPTPGPGPGPTNPVGGDKARDFFIRGPWTKHSTNVYLQQGRLIRWFPWAILLYAHVNVYELRSLYAKALKRSNYIFSHARVLFFLNHRDPIDCVLKIILLSSPFRGIYYI